MWKEGVIVKRVILFLIFSLLILPVFGQQQTPQCQLAIPRYGVVKCVSTSADITDSITLEANNDQSEGRYTCVTNCVLSNLPIPDCGFGWDYHWEVHVDGNVESVYKRSSWLGGSQGNLPVEITKGHSITIIGWCRNILTPKKPLPLTSVNIKKQVWRLEEGWAGTLDYVPVPETGDCVRINLKAANALLNAVAKQLEKKS